MIEAIQQRRRARAIRRHEQRLRQASARYAEQRCTWEDLPWELRGGVYRWQPGDPVL